MNKFQSCFEGQYFKYYVFGLLLVSLGAISFVAMKVGFLSPDSWNYLRLAESLSSGLGCSVREEYFAVFPCGYPALISFISWVTGFELFTASKILNFLALSLSGLFIFLGSRNLILSFLIVVNPITLAIGHYTWSENIFLLAVSLVFYASTKAFNGSGHRSIALPILVGLIVGVSSRYFFGPYALLMFLSIWLVYGSSVAKKVFPYFVFSGFLFIGYYLFNEYLTGYGSGMPRIPAPESLLLLFAFFLKYSVKQVIISFLAVAPIIFYALWLILSESKNGVGIAGCLADEGKKKSKPIRLIIFFGFSYLVLAFLIRLYSQFDVYGYRTVGYGFVFLIGGLVSYFIGFFRIPVGKLYVIAFFCASITSVILSQRGVYFELLSGSTSAGYNIDLEKAFDQYDSEVNVKGVVISLSIPRVKQGVARNRDIYYGGSVKVVVPHTAPYRERETFEELKSRVGASADVCFLDFTRIPDQASLEKILNSRFAVGLDIGDSIFDLTTKKEYSYHDSVAEGIRRLFVPGELVNCGFREIKMTQ